MTHGVAGSSDVHLHVRVTRHSRVQIILSPRGDKGDKGELKGPAAATRNRTLDLIRGPARETGPHWRDSWDIEFGLSIEMSVILQVNLNVMFNRELLTIWYFVENQAKI